MEASKVLDWGTVLVHDRKSGYRKTGVYDAKGNFLAQSLCQRGPRRQQLNGYANTANLNAVKDRLRGEYWFGGVIFKQFGHLLLETFSRPWLFSETDLPVLFAGSTILDLTLFWNMIDAFGISRNRVVVLYQHATVERLHVDDAGFRIREYMSEKMVRAFEQIGRQAGGLENTDATPVFLSRTATNTHRRYFYGEAVIENVLRRNGVHIVHMQNHSIAEQIRIVKTHRRIMGFTGSALHSLIYASDPKETDYFSAGPINENFHLVESRKQNDVRVYMLSENPLAQDVGLMLKSTGLISSLQGRGPWLLDAAGIRSGLESAGIKGDLTDADLELLEAEKRRYKTTIFELASDKIKARVSSGELPLPRAYRQIRNFEKLLDMTQLAGRTPSGQPII